MNKLKLAWKVFHRTVLMILVLGMLWILPAQALQTDADYSSHPGAPENPEMKEKTVYEGKRNIVNTVTDEQKARMGDAQTDNVEDAKLKNSGKSFGKQIEKAIDKVQDAIR